MGPWLMWIGTALQTWGAVSANVSQAEAEKQNADFYNEQAGYARDAMFRELNIASRNYQYRFGTQMSAIGRGGADFSGSVSYAVADTLANKTSELLAIKEKGELDVKLARLRGVQSNKQADTLGSFGYNALQAGTILTTNMMRAGDGFKSSGTPTPTIPGQGGSSLTPSLGAGGITPFRFN